MSLVETPATLRIKPNPSQFGAEVSGLDLARPLPPQTLARVKAAFLAHGVLWFPDQPLTHDQLETFTLQFGDFGWDPYVAPLAGRPHILEVRREPDETAKVFGGGWHSDWSFQETPPSATILHAKIIPPVGGDTYYADAIAAYEALSPAFQRLLTPLRTIHSAARPYGPSGFFAGEEGRKGMTILSSPEAEKTQVHPLVRTLQDGRRGLFINPTYTISIEGFSEAESATLLAFLIKHMLADAFIYRHSWAANMLTMWDNRRAMHNATGGYDGYQRVLHRTTVAGERPQ
ncbi:MAG TPA: TauD/TfdA family dioxygenase [Caulobacteraceae bacterium]|jgi:taurine dioxygenase|nr:TauD/TfdA family dioxygenase [Caulobacteraceae bacterium]